MALSLSVEILAATTTPGLARGRAHAPKRGGDQEIVIETSTLVVADLHDLHAAATSVGDGKAARAIDAIIRARAGRFDKAVPSFKALAGVLEAFLKHGRIDGWVYVTGDDGKLYPELVTEVRYDHGSSYGRSGEPTVQLRTVSYGMSQDNDYALRLGMHERTHYFHAHGSVNRRIADILASAGIFKETHALREAHLASLNRHYEVTQAAFAEQFRVTGTALRFEEDNYARRGRDLSGRRVVHDLDVKSVPPRCLHAESALFDGAEESADSGVVPEHPVVRVFDLRSHEFVWVHADNLEPYAYDTSLREKLVLPATHRDLLDVLTTDIGAFVSDFVEGKSAGNVILCKGIPGVGKTLTAEVYAELMRRPLYSVHSGELGTTAEAIETNLATIFQRGKRWNCVLLLDEADVFVVQRGQNIEQNAIVAEFLRALEYFDGLLFMTTNRPNDIDEAIISRCAAIIDYAPPGPADAAAIWRVLAQQYGAQLADTLIGDLVELFPAIAPRDIKMLLRLALRVASATGETLTLATFRRCAMFRAIRMAEAASAEPRLTEAAA